MENLKREFEYYLDRIIIHGDKPTLEMLEKLYEIIPKEKGDIDMSDINDQLDSALQSLRDARDSINEAKECLL